MQKRMSVLLLLHVVFLSACDSAPPGEGEAALGRLLIPRRYTDIDTSGIVIVVEASGNDDVRIELTDEAG